MKSAVLFNILLISAGAGRVFVQPTIISQPQSVTNLASTTATFSVTASGAVPLAFQWLFNSTIALASGMVVTSGAGISLKVTNRASVASVNWLGILRDNAAVESHGVTRRVLELSCA